MKELPARSEFARELLGDVAPQEVDYFEAYEAAVTPGSNNRSAGTGMGLPPEIAGALGMVAVFIGQAVFDKLLEWGRDLAWEVAKKFVVDNGAAGLRKWLLAPSKASLSGVLTPDGLAEILAIVKRDAKSAGLSGKDTKALEKALMTRLGFGEA